MRAPGKGRSCGLFRKGFTLVEIAVVCMVASCLLAVLYRLHSHFQTRIQSDVSKKLALQMNARRAADQLLTEVKKGTDIVRPLLGETTSFLVFKDIKNRMCILFLDDDKPNSETCKKPLYLLKSYLDDFGGSHKAENGKTLAEGVERIAFTAPTPGSIQINMTLANEKQSFQFVTHVTTMNLGDIE